MKFYKLLKAQMNKFIFIIFTFSTLSSQNIDLYFSLIDEGELNGVRENLPELLSKYPKDPGVLFLKATLTDDGESALKQYKYILKSFPRNTPIQKRFFIRHSKPFV